MLLIFRAMSLPHRSALDEKFWPNARTAMGWGWTITYYICSLKNWYDQGRPQKHTYLSGEQPNPNSLKFVVNEMLVPDGMSFDFADPEQAAESPLAQELFMYPFVDRVFFASNFITVTRRQM